MKKVYGLALLLVVFSLFGFSQNSEAKAHKNTAKPESVVKWEYPANAKLVKQSANDPVIADISKWQGNIDWSKASKALDLVIIRTQDGELEDYMHRTYESNAKKYNVPFGVYSFVRAGTPAEARAEARSFYNRASKDTEFYVLDVEVQTNKKGYSMRTIINEYMKEMRKLTNKKIGLYVAHHKYSSFKLDASKFNFVWIPRYGYSGPIYKHQLWQYTDSGRVPGINGNVDLNRLAGGTKLEYFTNKVTTISNSELVKKYYVTNPKYVLLKKPVNVYKKTSFDKKNKKKSYKEGTRLKVKKVVKSSTGIPRLQLADGSYISASKSLVLKTSATSNFYTTNDNVKQVMTIRNLYSYRSSTSNTSPEFVPANTIFNVSRVVYNGSGENRFAIINGRFISADKNDVVEVPATIQNYFLEYDSSLKLRTQKVIYKYDTLLFGDQQKDPEMVPVGTVLDIQDVVYNKLGYPRFKLTDGKYVSTKKTLFKQIPWYEQ